MNKSENLYNRALHCMPGGVNSPVRSFNAVGGSPIFFEKGEGAYLVDADGKRYIDFCCSWGPLILGHSHPAVVEAVTKVVKDGLSFGACHEGEIVLAEMITAAIPSIELVRLVSSGTEACMSAIRVARAATGRDLIVKCAGGYHGHADSFLVQAGSGAETLGIPSSPGVPESISENTLVIEYNDIDAARGLFEKKASKIAAVIVEPIAENMGVIPPIPGFLETLRDETQKAGALLIFDEVITGFRVGKGGAQEMYGIRPDMTCLGKILGGGMPLAAFGGKREIMEQLAPLGPVYQAGTLSGNPVAVAAGIATLEQLDQNVYKELDHKGAQLQHALEESAKSAGTEICINRIGSTVTPFLTKGPIRNLTDARRTDSKLYGKLFHSLVANGVYPPPSSMEAWFVSTQHNAKVLSESKEKIANAFKETVSLP